jgi:hypothetical protein
LGTLGELLRNSVAHATVKSVRCLQEALRERESERWR